MLKISSCKILLIAVAIFIVYGCSNSANNFNQQGVHASIDSTLANIQPQTDTGYRPYTRHKQRLDSLEDVAIEANYPNALSRIYFMVGSMYRWEEKFDTSLIWLEKSYKEVKGTNTLEEINTLLEIGDVYISTGKKKLANDYYYNAKFISEKINSTEATAKTFDRLSYVFYRQKSYHEALKMYKKTLMYNRLTKYMGDHKTLEMRLLNNIGVCYYKLKQYDKALLYYDSALLEANRLNPTPNTVAKGVFMGNKGRVYQLKGNYEKALELLTANTRINAKPGGDRRDVISSFTYLGEIYNALDSNKKFTAVTDTAIKYTYIVKNSAVLTWRAELFGLKANYYAKQKNDKLAYKYRTLQYTIEDSIYRADEKEDIKDIVLYRELKENENELLSLKQDNKTQQTRIFIYLTMVVLAIALLILTVIGLNTYRKSLKRQKNLNQKISEQNQQIKLNKLELEQAIEELKLLNTEKNRLLGMVAHDLRGPIYNITGVVQLLESSAQYSKLDESDAQLVELIKKSCENALEVINDLLDAAKLDNDGINGELEEANINDVVKDAIRLYQGMATQKNISINFSKPNGAVNLPMSKEKMNRAMGNLLSNAIKFSNKNSTVNITVAKTENNVLLSVSDNGIGIPSTDRDIIFDKFTKAKRPGTEGEKPVGLGMSIVKQIIEAHHGTIWLESEVGTGTTFYVELPLK